MAKNLLKLATKIAKHELRGKRTTGNKDIKCYYDYGIVQKERGWASKLGKNSVISSGSSNHKPRPKRPEWKGLVR